jgi:hypothetical protein
MALTWLSTRQLLMSQLGHLRRFWHVRSMSGWGADLGNADCPVLPIEGIGLDVIQTARDRTLRASDAEQRDRTMRRLSWGAHSREVMECGRSAIRSKG